MAVMVCNECRLAYDDTYRLTYCPHDAFAMRTVVGKTVDGKYVEKICTTIEEVEEFLKV